MNEISRKPGPTPWPNWQAPVSTRKARPAIMERAVEGKGLGDLEWWLPDRAVGPRRRLASSQEATDLLNSSEPSRQMEARR